MRSSLAISLATCAVLVAGCGSKSNSSSNGESTKTVSQIIADVQAATQKATAVHVSGSAKAGGTPLALDLNLVAGKGGAGHISYNGLDFDVIRIGDKAYFKGDAAFWQHFGGAAAATLFTGRWIEASAQTGDLASFTPLTDLGKLMNGILSTGGTLTKGASATIAGKPALQLVNSTQGGTLYVATTGTPYPLELKGAGSGNTGTIVFDKWDQPADLAAPAETIDYAKLKAAAG